MQEQLVERLPIRTDYDTVRARQMVRRLALELGFSMIAQTKIATVSSELVRNVLNYAKTGQISIFRLERRGRKGIKLLIEDNGPGMADVEAALQEGYSSASSLGLGLAVSSRFSEAFHIESAEGHGTKVTVINWVHGKPARRTGQRSRFQTSRNAGGKGLPRTARAKAR